MDSRITLFGVRHHGPGSARALLRALDELAPAALLIELPADVQGALEFAATPGMVPPLALLVHDEKEPARSSFYPFAAYSPEWQALQFAALRGLPVRAIDLPQGVEFRERAELEADAAQRADEALGVDEESQTNAADAADSLDGRGRVEPDQDPTATEERMALTRDPLDALARVAGHSDGEAWWDAIVERAPGGPAVFVAIGDAMAAARIAYEADAAPLDEAGAAPTEHLRPSPSRRDHATLRREAHMRAAIRAALAEFDGPLAVVVGAWHVPALRDLPPAKHDAALLKGVRPVRVATTWVPWTEPRLAAGSGYSAGVSSPGWYRHLWEESALSDGASARAAREPGTARLEEDRVEDGGLPDASLARAREIAALEGSTARWMTRIARLLREEGLAASTASAIDAARLAHGLAAVRGHARPGLAEMQDAALAALCHGEPAPLRVITRRLVIGEAIGEVPEGVPQMPLAADLAREQRRLRLKPEALERELAVDVRSEAGLGRSTLLHRLTLLGVEWGKLIDARAGRGTFREVWRLEWTPELSVHLAEALHFGTTIAEAASGAVRARVLALAEPGAARDPNALPSVEAPTAGAAGVAGTVASRAASPLGALAALVESALLAELPGAAELAIRALQRAAVATPDIAATMQAVGPLVDVLRYGSARRVPEDALRGLIEALTAQVLAGAVHAAHGIDAEAGAELARCARAFDRALAAHGDEALRERWLDVLDGLARDPLVSPSVAGTAARRLADTRWERDETGRVLARALSTVGSIDAAGAWLEGFLGGEAEVLLHDAALLAHVDHWLAQHDGEAFEALLPVLRRSFANFDAMERRRMLALVHGPRGARAAHATSSSPATLVTPAFERALPLLAQLLGLGFPRSASRVATDDEEVLD